MAEPKIVKNVRVEVSAAARENPPDPITFMKALVEQYFAELVAKREEFSFRPFFDEKAVCTEIKRLQTVQEQMAWSGVFRKYGCLYCHRKNLASGGCGFCKDCYQKIRSWKRAEVCRVGNPERDLDAFLSACDKEKLARAALTGTLPALPAPQGGPVQADEVISGESGIEPDRHSAWCVICKHPSRAQIERDFIHALDRGAVRAIARRYALKGTSGIYTHARAFGLNAKRAEKAGTR